MINQIKKLLGLRPEQRITSFKLYPAFLLIWFGFGYYLMIGSASQSQNYISELVSPLMHPDADLSKLTRIEPSHKDFSAYSVSSNVKLYIEMNTVYPRSRLLHMIDQTTFGWIQYAAERGKPIGTGRLMLLDTRMLATTKESPEHCEQYLKGFAPWLKDALNSKPWPLEFELITSISKPSISAINSSTFVGYSPPRIFALCSGSTFVFVTTVDH